MAPANDPAERPWSGQNHSIAERSAVISALGPHAGHGGLLAGLHVNEMDCRGVLETFWRVGRSNSSGTYAAERSDPMAEQKSAYVQKLKAQLEAWSADIQRLEAEAGKASADSQIKLEKTIDELRARKHDAEIRLKEIENASDEAWQELAKGADAAWNEITQSFERARAAFG
jgi:hypothetical protein